MIIQLQPMQVSMFWPEIKNCVMKTSRVAEYKKEEAASALLKNLLSGKFQCWVIFNMINGERRIHAMGVTSIVHDELFDIRSLSMMAIYGYRRLSEELVLDAFQQVKQYARANGCERMQLKTSSKRIRQLCDQLGLKASTTNYQMYI